MFQRFEQFAHLANVIGLANLDRGKGRELVTLAHFDVQRCTLFVNRCLQFGQLRSLLFPQAYQLILERIGFRQKKTLHLSYGSAPQGLYNYFFTGKKKAHFHGLFLTQVIYR
nr:hypothetical protein [Pseudomonas syringae]